jgi:hypothetical protein
MSGLPANNEPILTDTDRTIGVVPSFKEQEKQQNTTKHNKTQLLLGTLAVARNQIRK